jgi:hypothetical protein
MEFNFDVHGYLTPYRKIKSDLSSLKDGFVEPFDEKSTRHKLFQGYLNYNQELKKILEESHFTQWINGSFISSKTNPGDIDLVSLVDHKLAEKHEGNLSRFLNPEAKQRYGVDGYIVKVYPEGHPYYSRIETDLLYWEHWFTKSRKNRRKKRFPKGFLELEF